MKIPEANTIRGVKPQDHLKTPLVLTVMIPEGESDTVRLETRPNKKSGGEFKQYALFGRDVEGNPRAVQFLFDRDLQAVRKTYGEESLSWVGRTVHVRGEKDGDYYRSVVSPGEV